jgi:bis(5'-nucleosidyl)-tetraphosphatase
MVYSSGFIIVDFLEAEPKVLLLRAYHAWDFPKGRSEEGETAIDTAIRETFEETGLSTEDYSTDFEFAKPITYKTGKNMKTATYFFAERKTNKAPVLPINPELGFAEHEEWRWVPLKNIKNVAANRLLPVIDDLLVWVNKKFEENSKYAR